MSDDDELPSWMLEDAEHEEPAESRPAAPPVPPSRGPERPDLPTPNLSVTMQIQGKGKDAKFIQLLNKDGDSFFCNMDSGKGHWILPDDANLTQVRFICHPTDQGIPYFEDLYSKEVTWEMPESQMSVEALAQVHVLMKMNRKQCITIMNEIYNHDMVVQQINDLDLYADMLDRGIPLEQVRRNLDEITAERKKSGIHLNSKIQSFPEKDKSRGSNRISDGSNGSNSSSGSSSSSSSSSSSLGDGGQEPSSGHLSGRTDHTTATSDTPFYHEDNDDASVGEFTGDNPHNSTHGSGGTPGYLGLPPQGLKSGFMLLENKARGKWVEHYFVLLPYYLVYWDGYVNLEDEEHIKTKTSPAGIVQIIPDQVEAEKVVEGDKETVTIRYHASPFHPPHKGGEVILRMSPLVGDVPSSADMWVALLSNAATNLRAGGFSCGDIRLYMGLMRGYQLRFYILHKNSLTIYLNKLALTTPVSKMSINRKTRIEAVNDKKGRLTIINPTSVPKEKLICQIDLKRNAYRIFKGQIEALISASRIEDAGALGDSSIAAVGEASASNSFKAISFDDDDDASDAPILAAGGGPSHNRNEYWDGQVSTTASEADVEDVAMTPDPPRVPPASAGQDGPQLPPSRDDFTATLARTLEESDRTRAMQLEHQREKAALEARVAGLEKLKLAPPGPVVGDDSENKAGEQDGQEQQFLAKEAVDASTDIARRMFDKYKVMTVHDEDIDGNDDDVIELEGIRTVCYNLGVFYTQRQLIKSLSGYGDVQEDDAVPDLALLDFHNFVEWWKNHPKLKKVRLLSPTDVRRFEALKAFHVADRSMQGYVEENKFRHVFKDLVERDHVQPASPSLRAWTPSHSTGLLASTGDDPPEYTTCLENIRYYSSDRKTRANYAFVAHPGDTAASARAVQYPDFLSWVDATAEPEKEEQEDNASSSLLSSVAMGVTTLFKSTETVPRDASDPEAGGNGIPAAPTRQVQPVPPGKKASALEVIAAKKKAKGVAAPGPVKKAGADLEKGSEDEPAAPSLSPLQNRLNAVREAKKKANEQRDKSRKSGKHGGGGKKMNPSEKSRAQEDDSRSTSTGSQGPPPSSAAKAVGGGDERKDVRYSIEQRTISWDNDDDGAGSMGAVTPSSKGGNVLGVIGASTPGSPSGRGAEGTKGKLTPAPIQSGDVFTEEEHLLGDEGKLDAWELSLRKEIERYGGTSSMNRSTYTYGEGEYDDENEHVGAELDMYGRIYKRDEIPDDDYTQDNPLSPSRSPLKSAWGTRPGLEVSPAKADENEYPYSLQSDSPRKKAQLNQKAVKGPQLSLMERKVVRKFQPEIDYSGDEDDGGDNRSGGPAVSKGIRGGEGVYNPRGNRPKEGLGFVQEEDEEGDSDHGHGHHISRKAVDLSDLLLDMPTMEKWEQPVSTAIAKPGEVNRNTGPKVLAARATSPGAATSKASRRVSHLFIPDKALLPAELTIAPEKRSAGSGRGAPPPPSGPARKNRRSSVTVGVIQTRAAPGVSSGGGAETPRAGGSKTGGRRLSTNLSFAPDGTNEVTTVSIRDIAVQTGQSNKRRGEAHDSAATRYAGQVTATNILKSHNSVISSLHGDEDSEEEGEYTLQASLGRLSIQHEVPQGGGDGKGGEEGRSGSSTSSAIRRRKSGVSANTSLARDARAASPSSRGGRDDKVLSLGDISSRSRGPSTPGGHPLDKRGGNGEQEHEPKSAFHLILGERFAVEDIWQKVAAEEQAILAALEAEEDKAMHRIRSEEAKSLENVQRVWMERQMNVAELSKALEREKDSLQEDKEYLRSRNELLVGHYREQSKDFLHSFQKLQGNYEAVHKETTRLRHQAARAELMNIGLSSSIKDAKNELTSLKNAANVQEDQMRGFLKQLQPGYTRPLDLSDIKGLDSDKLFNGPGTDPHGLEALNHAVFGNQRDLAFQWVHDANPYGAHQMMRNYGDSGVEGAMGSGHDSSLVMEGADNTDPLFHRSLAELASYMDDYSPDGTHDGLPPMEAGLLRALRGRYTASSATDGVHATTDMRRVHIKAAKPKAVDPPLPLRAAKLQNKTKVEGYTSAAQGAAKAKAAFSATGAVTAQVDTKDPTGVQRSSVAQGAVAALMVSQKGKTGPTDTQRRGLSKSSTRSKTEVRSKKAAVPAQVSRRATGGGLDPSTAQDDTSRVTQSLHGLSLDSSEAKNITHVTSDDYEFETRARTKYHLEGTHSVGAKGSGMSFKSDAELKRLSDFKARRESIKKTTPQYAPPANRTQSNRRNSGVAEAALSEGAVPTSEGMHMSEFEEIQQSLHPFAMGHTTQGQGENSWRDVGGEEKFNTYSDSAGEERELETVEPEGEKGKKVMRRTPHHDARHRDSVSTKAAAEMRKPAVPSIKRNSATAQAKAISRRRLQKDRPSWQ